MRIYRSLKWTVLFLVLILAVYACENKAESTNKSPAKQLGPLEKIILKDSIQLGMSLDNVFNILKKQSDFVNFTRESPKKQWEQSYVKPESYPGYKLVLSASFKNDKVWSDRNTMSLSFTPPDFDEAPNQLYEITWIRNGNVDIDFDTITKFITQNGLQKPSCNTPFDIGSPGFVRTSWHAVWLQPYASYEPSYGECGPSYNIMENFDAFLKILVYRHGQIEISLRKAHLEKKFDEFFDTIKQMERREKGKGIKF